MEGRIIRSQYYGTQPVIIGQRGRVVKSEDVESVEEPASPYMTEEEHQARLKSLAEREEQLKVKLHETKLQADLLLKNAENEKNVMLESANEVARKVVDEATERADKMLDDAEQEIQRALTEAKKEGHDKGFKEGLADGKKHGEDSARKDLEETIKQANQLAQHTLETAKQAADDYMIQAEQNIVKVILAGIEKILPQHFIDVPQVILPFVQNAIQKVRDQKEVRVHVPAEAYDLVLMARDEFRSQLTDGTATLEIISDDSLHPGDCVIETPNGSVDARLQTQIEIIKQSIIDMLPRTNKILLIPTADDTNESVDESDEDVDMNIDTDETGMSHE